MGGLVEATAATGVEVAVVSFDAYRPRRQIAAAAVIETVGAARVLRVRGDADLDAARSFAADAVLHVHDGMLWAFAAGCASPWRVFTPHVVHRALNAVRGVTERTMSLAGEQAAVAGADVVVAPSRAAAGMLGVKDMAPLGVDLPDETTRREGPPTILHVGRFDAAKGTDDVVAIGLRVLRTRPDVVLEIAGGIPENAKGERRQRRRIEAAIPPEVVDRVRLLGWLDGAELEAAYARADVLLQPSRLETVGLAVLEAMARGVPVASTRCGGPEERITPETGRLTEVGDVDGAAAAVLELLDRPEMGVAARTAAQSWAWPNVVGSWLAFYRYPRRPGTLQARILDISE